MFCLSTVGNKFLWYRLKCLRLNFLGVQWPHGGLRGVDTLYHIMYMNHKVNMISLLYIPVYVLYVPV